LFFDDIRSGEVEVGCADSIFDIDSLTAPYDEYDAVREFLDPGRSWFRDPVRRMGRPSGPTGRGGMNLRGDGSVPLLFAGGMGPTLSAYPAPFPAEDVFLII
jgi:hypothetical protein